MTLTTQRYQLVGELTEETLMGWWGGSRYSGWVRNKKWMRLWIFVPSRERVHIPPWEKENHRLKSAFGGWFSKICRFYLTLLGEMNHQLVKLSTKHPSRDSNIYHITMIFVDDNIFSRLCTCRNTGDIMREKEPKALPCSPLIRLACFFFQGFTYSISEPFQKTMDHDQKNAGPKQKILQDPVVQDGLILEDRLNEAKWLGFFRL